MGVNEPGVVVPRALVASQAQGWITLFSATRLCNDTFAVLRLRDTRDAIMAVAAKLWSLDAGAVDRAKDSVSASIVLASGDGSSLDSSSALEDGYLPLMS
ncbi:unnamed protein product [Fusarium venenatum]|uniref:Uncharacterized protein n=1 Tax=Fusarium venenatum TaxID=56646 RepID=A0A2L2TEC6_9HYPO|nr:uncharacterized protein FVRRES_07193 [Fusarium venenatum]CEI62757.1 unnamed protein product [Fusarium venenatum]